MVGSNNDALYTLDTTTGEGFRVGGSNDSGVGEGSPSGLASHNGKLYMVGRQTNALYTLNTSTGVATRIGSAVNFGVNASSPRDLASG